MLRAEFVRVAAERLGRPVSTNQVEQAVLKGKIKPKRRVDGYFDYNDKDLNAFLKYLKNHGRTVRSQASTVHHAAQH